jgi:hypothetical protein
MQDFKIRTSGNGHPPPSRNPHLPREPLKPTPVQTIALKVFENPNAALW